MRNNSSRVLLAGALLLAALATRPSQAAYIGWAVGSGGALVRSTDGGNTWNNQGIPGTWLPYKSADVFVNPYYLGDYDTVVSDSLKLLPGLLGAYGTVDFGTGAFVPNQNVYAVSF